MTVIVRSFAKINLGLRIGGGRVDGFHELLTVYQTIGLYDVVRISVKRGNGIEIKCADLRVPRDESNTCYRIVEKAMQALGVKSNVVIEIEKRLPVQGGLGGASSNAVAALVALERALKKQLPAAEKLRIAAEVGSDLPLFLIGGTVLGVGRGEQVFPLPDLPATPCVVVTPEVGVSTPRAFAEWDRLHAAYEQTATALREDLAWVRSFEEVLPEGLEPARKQEMIAHERKLTPQSPSDRMKELGRRLSVWLSEPYSSAPSPFGARRGQAENPLLWLVRAGIENDFEEVVFPEYPELRKAKGALLRAGAKYASLSGSGSTLYGLFESRAAAGRGVIRLRKQGWAAQASATLTRAAYWGRMFAR